MRALVLAHSHYLAPVRADALPPLRAMLAAACRITFRRVDRFAQLALLGSARCAQGQALDAHCGVYLASALGPVASNIRVQEQVLRDREWPKPFDFIHTLGGSAGYYVASNLGLSGPDWFMGGSHALLDAMDMALTDLAAGVVPQALVGVVEELPLPLANQRARLGVSAGAVLAEGSHWWLLARAGTSGDAGRQLALHAVGDWREPDARLSAHDWSTACIGLARDLASSRAEAVRRCGAHVEDLRASALPFHASLEAAWFAGCAERNPSADVVLVANRQLLHLGP